MRAAPTLDEIRQWPAAVSIALASSAYGISRSHGFELARRGEFPARVIRAGGRYVVVTADIVRGLSAGGGDRDAA
jgi:hypothetical protein